MWFCPQTVPKSPVNILQHLKKEYKIIYNKDLLYNTGNSTQYSVEPIWEENLKTNGYMYIYNWITLLYN